MVVLEELSAEGFRRLEIPEERPLKFSRGITVIRGENEAGKSTIIEAILFALYGRQMRGKLESVINHRKKFARVSLKFRIGNRVYRVTRTLRRIGGNVRHEAWLTEVRDRGNVVIASGVREVEKEITRMTGLSFKEALVTNVVAQKELDKIISMSGSERDKIINLLLGLESYNRAIDRSRTEKNELKRELDYLERKMELLSEKIKRYRKALEEKERNESEILELREKVPEMKKELERARTYYEYVKSMKDFFDSKRKIEIEIRSLERELENLSEEIRYLSSEIEKALKRKEEREEEASNLEEEIEELSKRAKLLSEVDKVYEKFKREISPLFDEVSRSESLLEDKKREMMKLDGELDELKRRMKEEVEKRKKLEKRRHELDEAYSEARIGTRDLVIPGVLLLVSTLLFKYSPLFFIILALIGAFYLFYSYVGSLRRREEILRERREVEEEISRIKDRTLEISEKEKRLKEVGKTISDLERRLKENREELIEKISDLPGRYRAESIRSAMEEISKRISEDREERAKVLKELRMKEERLKEIKEEEINRLSKEIESKNRRKKEKINERMRIEERIGEARKRLSEMRPPNPPEGIEIDLSEENVSDELKKAERRYHEISNNLSATKERIKNLESRLKEIEKEIKSYEEEKIEEKYEDLKRKRSEMRERLTVLERLVHVLREVSTEIGASFSPSMERYMSEVISYVTGGRYKAVRLGERYEIEVFDSEAGRFIPKDIYSGGTIDQFLLAMRISFILSLLPQTKGRYPRFLFLDEPLSSSDSERRRNILRLMSKVLTRYFDQIFLITHVEVEGEGDWTEISVENGRVRGPSQQMSLV